MSITTNRNRSFGTGPEDLGPYLLGHAAGGYSPGRVVHACCECGSNVFHVQVDDAEGCAFRGCATYGQQSPMLDSAEYLDDADLEGCECPCEQDRFHIAVGFATRDDGSVRWVSIGLRCISCGQLGVYADWKIDYEPTDHLYESV